MGLKTGTFMKCSNSPVKRPFYGTMDLDKKILI